MSFDSVLSNIADTAESVSIPLEQGNVFRHLSLWCNHCVSSVSIPLEQGNVFRLRSVATGISVSVSQSFWNRAMSFDISEVYCINRTACLNPFGTGQCLSTLLLLLVLLLLLSQSLWNRAMSFDKHYSYMLKSIKTSQSLWNRAMSFDFSSYSNYSIYWVSIPLEQGNVFRLLLTLVLLS